MRADGQEKYTFTSAANKRGISERFLVILIGLLLALGVGLMFYYYHATAMGTLVPTPTPAPPTVTPIYNENGEPMPIHAWFPALEGESFFAKASTGETLLVDAGYEQDADALITFLQQQDVEYIDAVFLSLAEEQYLGGMESIIDTFPIGTFYLTPESAADERCASLLQTLNSKKISVQQVHASFISTVDWAEHAELRILSPHDVTYTSTEDTSLMLRLAYGSSEVLLTGSAGALAERMAVKALPNDLLHADVLKIPGQNNANSSSERFLGAVKPDIAVLCGAASDDVPAKNVLQRLSQKNIPLLATSEAGTIHIVLDGVNAKVVE